MNKPDELTISVNIGEGCTGNAFSNWKVVIAIFDEPWGHHTLPGSELPKVHPDLRWIISVPILSPENNLKVVGVLNVDCLGIQKTREEIEKAFQIVAGFSKGICKVLCGQV